MSNEVYLILVILIMGVATFLTRLFPFLCSRYLKSNIYIQHLGHWLPLMIMVILIVGSVENKALYDFISFFIYLLSIIAVLMFHHIYRKPLISIFIGTALFIFLKALAVT